MLTQPEREAVADGAARLPYATNDIVFRKGESADSLYILARGSVRIMDEDASGHRMALAELTAPDYFGEMGLLTGQPRGATVVAKRGRALLRLEQVGVRRGPEGAAGDRRCARAGARATGRPRTTPR